MIGKIFNNRYEIKEKLGAGGTAIVYKGIDTLLGRAVTIKILREEFANDAAFVRRFRREAQAVASLSHGNIVSVYDVGFEGNSNFIVMEFIEGKTLKEYIKYRGVVPVDEACAIMCQILDALAHAHAHGVIHRDIKPQNILFTKDGRVKVTDFGIAVGMSEMTQTYNDSSVIMGSVHYISPEQIQGLNVSEKSDIYSAGVVFYEMLTGKLPYNGDSPISVAMQHVTGVDAVAHEVNQDIPLGISHIAQKAMRKNADSRYSTALEMKESITAAMNSLVFAEQNGEVVPPPVDLMNGNSRNNKNKNNSDNVGNSESRNKVSNRPTAANADSKGREEYGKKSARKLSGFGVTAVVATVLVVAILIVMWLAMHTIGQSEDVSVPNVEGKTLVEAGDILKELGLTYTTEPVFTGEVAKDMVVTQDTPADTIVKQGRSIILRVSQGAKQVAVPNVMGKKLADAETLAANKNLKLESKDIFSSEIVAGEIIEQIPEAGENVDEGSVIKVIVSKGAENKFINMPELTGKTVEEAKKTITENKLTVGKETKAESAKEKAGVVMKQSVNAGLEVLEGTAIDLLISDGPGVTSLMANVIYHVPDDGLKHVLKIVVKDSTGTHEEYNQSVSGGTSVDQTVPFYTKGTIEIYLDEVMVYVKDVPETK